MSIEGSLKTSLDKVVVDLREKYEELGMKASGRWGESLEVTISESNGGIRGTILGERYTEQLERGRKSGRFPPVAAIEAWIDSKGIVSDIPKKSLAFLIARKIAKEGTRYYQQGGTGLVSSVVTDDRMNEVIEDLGSVFGEVVINGFIKELKTITK
jgi:hypothetical protein